MKINITITLTVLVFIIIHTFTLYSNRNTIDKLYSEYLMYRENKIRPSQYSPILSSKLTQFLLSLNERNSKLFFHFLYTNHSDDHYAEIRNLTAKCTKCDFIELILNNNYSYNNNNLKFNIKESCGDSFFKAYKQHSNSLRFLHLEYINRFGMSKLGYSTKIDFFLEVLQTKQTFDFVGQKKRICDYFLNHIAYLIIPFYLQKHKNIILDTSRRSSIPELKEKEEILQETIKILKQKKDSIYEYWLNLDYTENLKKTRVIFRCNSKIDEVIYTSTDPIIQKINEMKRGRLGSNARRTVGDAIEQISEKISKKQTEKFKPCLHQLLIGNDECIRNYNYQFDTDEVVLELKKKVKVK